MKNNKMKPLKVMIPLILILCLFSGLVVPPQNVQAAQGKYLIKVNKQQNCVTVYGKDSKGQYTVPVKAMVCSCGISKI